MIKYTEIKDIFANVGIEVYEYNIETNDDIATPFFVYTAIDGDYFEADGINYFKTLNVALAMIDEDMNFPMQRVIEKVLDDNYTRYDKQINFDSEVRLYSVAYSFEVLDDSIN